MNKVWVYCIFLLLFVMGCQKAEKRPKAVKGYLDLRQWSFDQQPEISLNGQWEFFWQKYYLPDQNPSVTPAYVKVPSAWTKYTIDQHPLPDKGFATYRLRVILDTSQVNQPLAINVRIIQTAYHLYVQGKYLGGSGIPATSAQATHPELHARVYTFEPRSDTVEVLLHVACFHNNSGGLSRAIELGRTDYLTQNFQYSIYVDFLLMGSLFIIALYHFSLYYFRRQNLAPIYFGLFCLIVALRLLALSAFNVSAHLSWVTYEYIQKASYLTYYVGTFTFLLFIRSLFTEEFKRVVIKIATVVVVPLTALVVLSHNYIYNKTLPYYQLFSLLVILYVFYVLTLAAIRKKSGARTFLLGFVAIAVTIVNDILHANHTIDTAHYAPWGLFIFVLAQAVVLSGRFSKAFIRAEDLTFELNDLNQSLEQKVKDRTQSLDNTRGELQRKNDNITASINYAQRIQNAMLPRWAKVQEDLPESFLMFHPKDLVSGDFYWFAKTPPEPLYKETMTFDGVHRVFKGLTNEKLILAAVDCTGHGVPGAFMSLIGNNLLNQIILEQKIVAADVVLHELNVHVKQSLKQNETHNRDGMDITLVVIDQQQKTMDFAGAQNPLYCIQNEELKVIKGTKSSIGGRHHNSDVLYDSCRISIDHPTTFYMASDGFQDQFGGKDNKKFMVRRFRKLLYEIHRKPMPEQKEILEQTLSEWMQGEYEQIDDILVIGVKLS
ncbi:7TM diverse intracellular signaling domain-containing protein [Microscilla marina]|uniref:Serine/threonine protein kinases n=1 Tax=Microscilla marina ATCC 23134 TaxID=313606 RepID=A1ZKH2_MICM2|nr:7TM diverse intracellular signaling domain-containing protein [Microscilla marina]EAY29198.1 serine/threonine protein kinases [Microscilla marina ATCC 23134]